MFAFHRPTRTAITQLIQSMLNEAAAAMSPSLLSHHATKAATAAMMLNDDGNNNDDDTAEEALSPPAQLASSLGNFNRDAIVQQRKDENASYC